MCVCACGLIKSLIPPPFPPIPLHIHFTVLETSPFDSYPQQFGCADKEEAHSQAIVHAAVV